MNIRVRFPPSPTGLLHIGGLRTALYNFLFVRRHGGTFVVRIEDTDRTRLVPGALENILEMLAWAGIEVDEGLSLGKKLLGGTKIHERGSHGPYLQSKRLDLYRTYATKLVKEGKAYYCFCTSERLEVMRKEQEARKEPPMYDGRCRGLSVIEREAALKEKKPYVIRLSVPVGGETVFDDEIRGEVRFENKTIDDQVLLKSDGFPTYHLANVIDDHLMEITHVIRGEEWISSTPKHILLYFAFGWTPPSFAHVPLLLNADRSKLSKRTGDVAVSIYRDKGYLPEALVNFVALLGWNPRADREIYTIDELISEFDLHKVNKSGAVVNMEKLDWINGAYIRKMPVVELRKRSLPWFEKSDLLKERITDSYLEEVLTLARERVHTLAELPEASAYFFGGAPNYDAALLAWKETSKTETREHLGRVRVCLIGIGEGEWSKETLEVKLKALIDEEKLGIGETLWPMRVALTGRKASPGPFEVAAVLGKIKTLERIQHAINKLS